MTKLGIKDGPFGARALLGTACPKVVRSEDLRAYLWQALVSFVASGRFFWKLGPLGN